MNRIVALALAASLLAVSAAPVGAATATQRPLSDWLDAQQVGVDPTVPIEFQVISWFDPSTGDNILLDLDGRVATWVAMNGGPLHMPEFQGRVTERLLADGRAEVHVRLRVTDAITYIWRDENDFIDFPEGPELFGYRASEIAAGAPAALGNAWLTLKFIHTDPGGPLPDFVLLAFDPEPGWEIISVTFHAAARGALREASGFPEGTPGIGSTQQVGLFTASTPDGFPVEWVRYRPIGR